MDFYNEHFSKEGNFMVDLFLNKIKMIKNKDDTTINIIIEQIIKNSDVLINSKRFFYKIISLYKININEINVFEDFTINDVYFKNTLNKLIYYYIIIDLFSLKIYNKLIQKENEEE